MLAGDFPCVNRNSALSQRLFHVSTESALEHVRGNDLDNRLQLLSERKGNSDIRIYKILVHLNGVVETSRSQTDIKANMKKCAILVLC